MTTSPLLEKVRGIAADVLQVGTGEITPQSSTETIEGWDSLRHLSLILAFEQEFGVQFEPEDIDSMNSVERIVGGLEAKLDHRA